MKWNYESSELISTGYEDIEELLKSYKREDYLQLSDEDRKTVIDEVFKIYRERNIFPIKYYSEEGIRQEIQKCLDFNVEIKEGVVNYKGIGSGICNYLFPNLFESYNVTGVQVFGAKNAIERFYNDDALKKCIRFALQCDGNASPRSVMKGVRQSTATPYNFQPMNAKAIDEKYCPENGVIYDFSAGYGGRMLGALTSTKNFTYVACEPNTETYNNLQTLGNYIESVTKRKGSYKIVKMGSEDFIAKESIFDFAFSSPPYFNLEHYSDEVTQCYNRYPDLYDWVEYYVRGTIKNIYSMLKSERYYAVNIADFVSGGKKINYVDIWKAESEKVGFKYVEDISLKISSHARPGNTNTQNKSERIMVFYKS